MCSPVILNGRLTGTEWADNQHWMRRGIKSQSMAITNKNGCACVCHGSEPVMDIIRNNLYYWQHSCPAGCSDGMFFFKQASFPDQCGIWLNSDVAFGLILMWRLAWFWCGVWLNSDVAFGLILMWRLAWFWCGVWLDSDVVFGLILMWRLDIIN